MSQVALFSTTFDRKNETDSYCFFQGFQDKKILYKTEPHEVCDLSHAYFYLGVCQGVRVPSHAWNDQNWITEVIICFNTSEHANNQFVDGPLKVH